MFSIQLFTFTSWIFPETHFSTSFKTISVYLTGKQVELASVHCELCKIRLFHDDTKSTDQQNECQKLYFMEILFRTIRRYMDTPSKVAHTKYAVAETRIPV